MKTVKSDHYKNLDKLVSQSVVLVNEGKFLFFLLFQVNAYLPRYLHLSDILPSRFFCDSVVLELVYYRPTAKPDKIRRVLKSFFTFYVCGEEICSWNIRMLLLLLRPAEAVIMWLRNKTRGRNLFSDGHGWLRSTS